LIAVPLTEIAGQISSGRELEWEGDDLRVNGSVMQACPRSIVGWVERVVGEQQDPRYQPEAQVWRQKVVHQAQVV